MTYKLSLLCARKLIYPHLLHCAKTYLCTYIDRNAIAKERPGTGLVNSHVSMYLKHAGKYYHSKDRWTPFLANSGGDWSIEAIQKLARLDCKMRCYSNVFLCGFTSTARCVLLFKTSNMEKKSHPFCFPTILAVNVFGVKSSFLKEAAGPQ